MKISYNWLKQYVKTNLTSEEVADLLTNCGLEVEAIELYESIKGGLEGLLIGKVISCEKHPDADRLSLTQVDIGQTKPLSIVCGAPNVQKGQYVVVAPIGVTLYPATGDVFKIKKTKIRGVESEGMICAEDEIGTGNSHDGIIVLSGEPLVGSLAADYFRVEKDIVFEIGLTPNRSDAASHIGVARDLAALLNVQQHQNIKLNYPTVDNFHTNGKQPSIHVHVKDTKACPRYTGLCITGVTVKESPLWLKNRLNAINVRPVNNIVDATQYVLFELGQPLHAFDADKITGESIIVKKAADQTPFITLDGIERKLSANDLMICNTAEPMCIAGVFGGKGSGITAESTNVFLESAYFAPAGIRQTAKYHGLKTDASFRYERGCDPNITIYAIKRAAILIQELAGGEISEITDCYPEPVTNRKITLNYAYLNRLIGKEIEKEMVKNVLASIELNRVSETDDDLTVSIPTNKVDVTRPADVVEEFLRIYGYNHIEVGEKFNYTRSFLPQSPLIAIQETISDYLSNNGFYQTINNSLTKIEYVETFDFIDASQVISLLNPLSRDLQYMRQTLLFNSLENVIHNLNHGTTDIKLYEFGTVYCKNKDVNEADVTKQFSEQNRLSICISGKIQAESWQEKQTDVNFYYLKNILQNVMNRLNIPLREFKTVTHVISGGMNNVLQYMYNDTPFVTIGTINDTLLKYFDIHQSVFYAEVDRDILGMLPKKRPLYTELNRFPEVSRDLALLIDKKITYKELEDLAFKTEKKHLKSVNLFDVYEGKNIEESKKSYAIRFILFDKEKTLTNEEINRIMDKLIAAYQKEFDAKLR
ncbi:MAG: phenylalanine--tRNA ligase subunit beta [Bacteroidales bacterium]|jgi:phenylalanyl-tRNA synthetase beta chain|nr:phenylalanine--tRNA ligase subunit beta [Bacteroidales bacterium]